MSHPRTHEILGVPVRALTLLEANDVLEHALEMSQPTPVAFLNANAAVHAYEDPRQRELLKEFVVFNDGIGVDIGCCMKYGTLFPANLNGTDFIPFFFEETKRNLRIYLLGARPEVVREAARVLSQRFPAHRVVGFQCGYFPKERNAEVAEDIRRTDADVLLVAMGNAKQEKWIANNIQYTGVTLAFGVGGLFDFISNRVPRAPRFVRALRAEWLWRLTCEPRRLWKRYTMGSAKFLAYTMKDAITYRLGAKVQPSERPLSISVPQ